MVTDNCFRVNGVIRVASEHYKHLALGLSSLRMYASHICLALKG